jgi:hypothetical protein
MDLDMFDSNEENDESDNHSTNGVCHTETINSEHSKHELKKWKGISKKNYEPICDGNAYIKYEDNPTEYKRLRKYLNCDVGKSKTEKVLLVLEVVRKEHCRVCRWK